MFEIACISITHSSINHLFFHCQKWVEPVHRYANCIILQTLYLNELVSFPFVSMASDFSPVEALFGKQLLELAQGHHATFH